MSTTHTPVSPRQAALNCLFVLATALMCAALVSAALLVPAPPAAVPVIVLVCTICPILASYHLPASVVALRVHRANAKSRRELIRLRRALAELPETEHPLGL